MSELRRSDGLEGRRIDTPVHWGRRDGDGGILSSGAASLV